MQIEGKRYFPETIRRWEVRTGAKGGMEGSTGKDLKAFPETAAVDERRLSTQECLVVGRVTIKGIIPRSHVVADVPCFVFAISSHHLYSGTLTIFFLGTNWWLYFINTGLPPIADRPKSDVCVCVFILNHHS